MKIPKNKNAVIGTQNDQYLTQCSLMTNHLIVLLFFYILGLSCNELVLNIAYIIVIFVLLIIILILIIVLRRLGSGAGKL